MLPSPYALCSDPELLVEHYGESAEAVARYAGIHIVRGRELTAVVLCDGEVCAALWTELFCKTFSFDFAVQERHRKKGIGTHLAKLGISLSRDMNCAVGACLDIGVVSDESERILRREGLIECGRFPGGLSMAFPSAAMTVAGR